MREDAAKSYEPIHRMHRKSVVLRPVAAAAAAAIVLNVLAPLAPPAEPAPVKVRAAETSHAVVGSHDFAIAPNSTHVAVHWLGSPDAQVTAALSSDGSSFSSPVPIDVEEANGPVPDAETYGSIINVDGTTVVRVSSDRPLTKVSVLALDASGPEPPPLGLGAQAAAATTMPPVIPRSSWGADESLRFDDAGDEQWPREYFPVQMVVIHHTAGRNADPDPAATVRAIYYYHAVTRRWADIGYNYLIDEAGRVYEGRYARDFWNGAIPSSDNVAGLGVAAGHTKFFNQGTLGIALLGTFSTQAPTSAARASLVRMLAWASAKYGINPQGTGTYVNPQTGISQVVNRISGHRDFAATDCPGGAVYGQLPAIRADAAAQMNPWPGQVFNPARTLFFAAGTYVGKQFSSTGALTGSKAYTLAAASSAATDQASSIPLQSGTWYHVTTGVWAGYWIQASSSITLSGAPSLPALDTFETARPLSVAAGTYVGRRFNTWGDVISTKSYTLASPSTLWTTQRGTIPKQSGSWYFVTVGVLDGYWIPAASTMTLGAPPPPFPSPIAIFDPPRQLLFAPGTFMGQRFSAYGISAGTYTATLTSSSSAPTSRYSTLPGQTGNWFYIIDGVFESYWIRETAGTTLLRGVPPPTTDLVFDVTGYFVPDASGATFVALNPARLLDSRFGNGLSGKFSAGVPRSFQVSGRGGVPANASAVTGNLTVTNASSSGAAFLGPLPTANPSSSTLNFPVADNRANGVTVALGAGGTLSITYLAY